MLEAFVDVLFMPQVVYFGPMETPSSQMMHDDEDTELFKDLASSPPLSTASSQPPESRRALADISNEATHPIGRPSKNHHAASRYDEDVVLVRFDEDKAQPSSKTPENHERERVKKLEALPSQELESSSYCSEEAAIRRNRHIRRIGGSVRPIVRD